MERGQAGKRLRAAAGDRRKIRGLLCLLAGMVFSGTLAGCGTGTGDWGPGDLQGNCLRTCAGSEQAERHGDFLQLAGSSSMERYVDALAEGFMEGHPEVTVTVEFTGSSAGIEAVVSGRADIGNSSRNLSRQERERGAVETIVAMDGIAVCVDASNPVDDMTKTQLADIYTGKITDWSALGGGSLPIVVVGREAGSGTREAFEELVGISGQCTYANELDSMGAVMARVAATPGAIGYVSFDVANVLAEGGDDPMRQSVALLALDGIAPTVENLKDGSYVLRRPFVMVTKGELSVQEDLVQEWFRYVGSREGREIAEKVGLAPIDETE